MKFLNAPSSSCPIPTELISEESEWGRAHSVGPQPPAGHLQPLSVIIVLARYTLIWDLIYLPRHPLGKYDLLALTMVEMQFDHVSFPLALSCHHRESISLLSLGKRLVPLSFLTYNRGNTCQFFSRTLSWSSIPVSDKSKPKISAARNFFQWPPFSAVIFPIDLWWCGREGGPYSFLIGKRKAITLYQCIFPETFP